MKWNDTQPARDTLTVDAAESLVQWALDNGKSIRGYALLWHNQIPQFVIEITEPAEMRSAIEGDVGKLVEK
jgi:endo-1,4-beta-xylanase